MRCKPRYISNAYSQKIITFMHTLTPHWLAESKNYERMELYDLLGGKMRGRFDACALRGRAGSTKATNNDKLKAFMQPSD